MRTWMIGLVALALGAYGSPRAYDARQTPAAGPVFTAAGAFVALSVADMAAGVRWYTEKLGLTVVLQEPRTNGVAATVLEGGGLIVELIQARGVAFYLGPFPARPNRRANVLIKDNAGNLLQFFGK